MKTSTIQADQEGIKPPALPVTPSVKVNIDDSEYLYESLKTRYTFDVYDTKDEYKHVVTLSIVSNDRNLEDRLKYALKKAYGEISQYKCVLKLIEVLE